MIFITASNSKLAFTIIINSPQTKLNSDQLSGFIGGIQRHLLFEKFIFAVVLDAISKSTEQTISHPLPNALYWYSKVSESDQRVRGGGRGGRGGLWKLGRGGVHTTPG